ncbi:MAG: Dna2/Cas4 domain-containing protein, partial [Caldilinea sp.]|nr:Dna2/Cas4 domain-containing protein [Caldilinea sp.]
MQLLWLLAFLLLCAGLALVWIARRGRHASGLPAGAVVYSDTGAEQAVPAPLISRRYGLIGKPDYLIEARQGAARTMIPVEVKSRSRPGTPPSGHILQLATYCLIIEDIYGTAPSHGVLRYADGSHTIAYTPDLRRAVLDAAEHIRAARTAPDVPRSH